MSEIDRKGYRFGPLERRGLILGLRPSQLVVLGIGGFSAVMILRSLPELASGPLTLIAILASVAVSFWPIKGRTLEAWLPLIAAFGWRRLCRRHRFVSGVHLRGHLVLVDKHGEVAGVLPPSVSPASVRGLVILEAQSPAGEGAPAGVIKDSRGHTYSAALCARGRSFSLLDEEEQRQAVESWASILAGYAGDHSLISRLQWIERTVPDDGRAVIRHFEHHQAQDAPEGALRVYQKLISGARPPGQEHECLVVLQLDARRSWRRLRQLGKGDVDSRACTLLLRELTSLANSLESAGVNAQAPLTARQLAAVIRTAYEPEIRPKLKLIDAEGSGPQNPWPQASGENLASYQAGERSFHAVFHVREWPRIEAPPSFLSPLLLGPNCTRAVSVIMEPVPAARAVRELRGALVADASDDHLKEKAGWMSSFRSLRERENVQRAEQELTDGHAAYRFSAYVTVSAPSRDELEEACGQIEVAASRSHLELERLLAQQEMAFTYTLPLGRGLK